MAISGTLTDKGTRKFQCNGLAKWGAVMQRLAGGGGKREALGIRAALAYAVEHEATVASWVEKNAVSTLGVNVVKEVKAPKAKKEPKAKRAKAPKAPKKAKAPKAEAKAEGSS